MLEKDASRCTFAGARNPRLRGTRLHLSQLLFVGSWSVMLSMAASVHMQATRIFVASFGSDANDGSRGNNMLEHNAGGNAAFPASYNAE